MSRKNATLLLKSSAVYPSAERATPQGLMVQKSRITLDIPPRSTSAASRGPLHRTDSFQESKDSLSFKSVTYKTTLSLSHLGKAATLKYGLIISENAQNVKFATVYRLQSSKRHNDDLGEFVCKCSEKRVSMLAVEVFSSQLISQGVQLSFVNSTHKFTISET